MKSYIIIPARLKSTRLPNKILLNKTGKYLLLYTLEQALKSKSVTDVFIATDSKEVVEKITPFYEKIYLTPANISSGTDRCLYLANKLHLDKNSYIINWQADEPYLHPDYVDKLLLKILNKKYKVGTLIAPPEKKYINDPNTVKVIINKKNEALFFFRNFNQLHCHPDPAHSEGEKSQFPYIYFHIGLYIYKFSFLQQFSKMKSNLEKILKLEQLRILENGYKIYTTKIPKFHKGIDTHKDYLEFTKNMQFTK